jgi:outer membrane protein assembly factor BamB/plastocyanin
MAAGVAAMAPAGAQGAVTCAKTGVPGGDWPTFGEDAGNTRFQEREKVISPADVPLLSPAWTFSTAKAGGEGDIAGTPIVTSGCVYTATSRGWVFALNADTGAVVWKNRLPYGGGTTASVGVGPRSSAPGPPSCAKTKASKRKAKKRKSSKRRAKSSAKKRKAKKRARKKAKRRKALCATKKKAKRCTTKRKGRAKKSAKRKCAKRRARKRSSTKRSAAAAKPRRKKKAKARSCVKRKRKAKRKRSTARGKKSSAAKAKKKSRHKKRKCAKPRKRAVAPPQPSGQAVYVAVSRTQASRGCPAGQTCQGPYVAAFDRATGKLLWATPPIDKQPGSDSYGSPVMFDGVLMVGISGGSAELGDEADRYAFQGSMNFLDTYDGRVIKKTWTIHPPHQPEDNFAGAGIWSTPAIDAQDKVAFVGAANPFKPQAEHPHANSVLKFDIDRSSPRFGQITGNYKGDIDEYVPGLSQLPCYDFPGNNAPYYPQGLGSCGDIDLDFGASPNLITGPGGRKLVGAGQKSGVYHVFDAKTMKPVWKQIVGPPTSVGGIVGSTAYDGGAVYGPITVPGYTWSLAASNGAHRWIGPVGDGAHWGEPVAVANGVMYTVDLNGYLDAYDTRSGALLVRRPLALGGSGPASLSWGGVAIARNTIYAGVGLGSLPEGFIVALKPGSINDLPEDIQKTLGGGGGGGGGNVPLGSAIVTTPGATSTGYATPVMATQVGGPLSYVNLDAVQHDVTSDQKGLDGRPLFFSKLSGLGEVSPVQGLDKVQSGQSYGFYCSIHPGMRGTLVVR